MENRACGTRIFEVNRWIRRLAGTDGSILCFPDAFLNFLYVRVFLPKIRQTWTPK
jgi:hypothetical protein